MATLDERLTKRFRNVPGVTSDDISDWIAEAEAESGKLAGGDDDNALLYLAYSIGCMAIATEAARYFNYTDAEESVDKRGIAEEYRKLAAWARQMYAVQLRGGRMASSSYPARGDGR